jgi:hypothetical protein
MLDTTSLSIVPETAGRCNHSHPEATSATWDDGRTRRPQGGPESGANAGQDGAIRLRQRREIVVGMRETDVKKPRPERVRAGLL